MEASTPKAVRATAVGGWRLRRWWGLPLNLNYLLGWLCFLLFNWLNERSWNRFEGIDENQGWITLAIGMLNTLALILGALLMDAGLEWTLSAKRTRPSGNTTLAPGSVGTSVERTAAAPGWSGVRWAWSLVLGAGIVAYACDHLLFGRMGLHLGTGLRLLGENGWSHFRQVTEAMGMRIPVALTLATAVGVLLAVAVLVARVTRWIVNWSPLYISAGAGFVTWLVLVIGLLLGPSLSRLTPWGGELAECWREQRRVLPFSLGVGELGGRLTLTGAHLRPMPTGAPVAQEIERAYRDWKASASGVNIGDSAASSDTPATGGREALPDIVVFVLESFRGDHVEGNLAPALTALSQDCLQFRDSLAAADATHLSWYTLFTGNYPLHSALARKRPDTWGSPPLRLLRQMGYEIHLISSSYMRYHASDEVLLGRQRELATSFVDGDELGGMERPERDRETIRRLRLKLEEKPGGRLILVFLESTHHDYYWPSDFAAPFQPVAEGWVFFDFQVNAQELEAIHNRYRNAVHFVDDLIGGAIRQLKEAGRYEETMLFVTGDHGEEFLEHGKLLHASETCRVQTHVPFLLKLNGSASLAPEVRERMTRITATHADFLPTVLDWLQVPATNLCDGESLFRKEIDFAVMAEQNGARDSHRFCLYADGRKAWLQYPEADSIIALESRLVLRKVTDANDRILPLPESAAECRRVVQEWFGPALRKVFPGMK